MWLCVSHRLILAPPPRPRPVSIMLGHPTIAIDQQESMALGGLHSLDRVTLAFFLDDSVTYYIYGFVVYLRQTLSTS